MTTIALVGAPGSGKSTVGRLLASRLGATFIDVDQVIAAQAGKEIAEIFADDGEAVFRSLEESATVEALKEDAVVSLGGGAVLSEKIRRALDGIETVWLEVSIQQASRRVGMNRARPLLWGGVRARLIELLRERTPLYRSVATFQVNTDELSPLEVVDLIESEVRRDR